MAKTYDTYKDSSIAWIGNIPSEWEIKKLGNFYTQRNEKVSDKDFFPIICHNARYITSVGNCSQNK